MPKISGSLKIWKPFIVFSLIFWLAAAVYLVLFYDWEQTRLHNLIIANSEYGYGILNAKKVVNLEPDSKFQAKDLVIDIKPGDTYTGKIAVKNNDKAYTFKMLKEDFVKATDNTINSTEEPKKFEFQPTIQFNPNEFFLDKNELKIVEYTLSVPKDFPLGGYKGILKSYPPEKFENQIDPEKGITVILMVGVKVNLKVSENPKDYQYAESISDPIEVAKRNVGNRLRIILIVFFASLGLMFIVHARRFSNQI